MMQFHHQPLEGNAEYNLKCDTYLKFILKFSSFNSESDRTATWLHVVVFIWGWCECFIWLENFSNVRQY